MNMVVTVNASTFESHVNFEPFRPSSIASLDELCTENEQNSTVEAPKFGPHGNFGPLFQKGLLPLKRVLRKK